jgi:hypothetical protein
MMKYDDVKLKKPLPLPDKLSMTTLKPSADVSIRRQPALGSPAELVVVGPWGETRVDWDEYVNGYRPIFELGATPHREVLLSTASEFVAYLTEDHGQSRHLFRGVQNSSFELVPVALRDKSPTPPFGRVLHTNKEQIEHEVSAVVDFYDSAYYQGLTIPKWDHVAEFVGAARRGDTNLYEWVPEGIREFAAIAQHHGVPTRLLDWTLDPMVAAYFAAFDFESTAADLAVWIVDLRAAWGDYAKQFLHPVAVPYDVNRNAHAQRGVFTALPLFGGPNDEPSRQPLDQVLSTYCVEDPPDGVRKVTLPREQAATLLRLLDRIRVNGGTMFPGYYGAARAARERAFWERGAKLPR